ncbi:MAG: hypothetical protein M0Z42_04640 [Actinomycetota bacterium]|jgi:hypothetical protein|nr:hypothetical protein [Actinomycetota bacterium]
MTRYRRVQRAVMGQFAQPNGRGDLAVGRAMARFEGAVRSKGGDAHRLATIATAA